MRCSRCRHAHYCSAECQTASPLHVACRNSASSPHIAYQTVLREHGSLIGAVHVGVSMSQVREALRYLRSNESQLQVLFSSVSTAQCVKPHRFLSQFNEFAVAIRQFDIYSTVDFPVAMRGKRSFDGRGLTAYRERFRVVAHSLRVFMEKFWPAIKPMSSAGNQIVLLQIRSIIEELLQGEALLRDTDQVDQSVVQTLNKLVRFIDTTLFDPLAEKLCGIMAWIGRYASSVLAADSSRNTEVKITSTQLGIFGTEVYLETVPTQFLGPKIESHKSAFQTWLAGLRTALRQSTVTQERIRNEPVLRAQPDLFALTTSGQLADLLDEPDLRFFADAILPQFLSGFSSVDTMSAMQKILQISHNKLVIDPSVDQVIVDSKTVQNVAETVNHPQAKDLELVTAEFYERLQKIAGNLKEHLSRLDRDSSEFREIQFSVISYVSRSLITGEALTDDGLGITAYILGDDFGALLDSYFRMTQLMFDIECDLADDFHDEFMDDLLNGDDDEEIRPQPVPVQAPGDRGRSPRRPGSQAPPIPSQPPPDPRGRSPRRPGRAIILANQQQQANLANDPSQQAILPAVANAVRAEGAAASGLTATTRRIAASWAWWAGAQVVSNLPGTMWGKFASSIAAAAFLTVANYTYSGVSNAMQLYQDRERWNRMYDYVEVLEERDAQWTEYFKLNGVVIEKIRSYIDPSAGENLVQFGLDCQGSHPISENIDANVLTAAYKISFTKLDRVMGAIISQTVEDAVDTIRRMTINPGSYVNVQNVPSKTNLATESNLYADRTVLITDFIVRSGQSDWIDLARSRMVNQLDRIEASAQTDRDRAVMRLLGGELIVGAAHFGVNPRDIETPTYGTSKVQFGPTTTLPKRDYASMSPAASGVTDAPDVLGKIFERPIPLSEQEQAIFEQARRDASVAGTGLDGFLQNEKPLVIAMVLYALLWGYYALGSNDPNARRYTKKLAIGLVASIALTMLLILPEYLDILSKVKGEFFRYGVTEELIKSSGIGGWILYGGQNLIGGLATGVKAMAGYAGPAFRRPALTFVALYPNMLATLEYIPYNIIGLFLRWFRGEAGPAHSSTALVPAGQSPSGVSNTDPTVVKLMEMMIESQRQTQHLFERMEKRQDERDRRQDEREQRQEDFQNAVLKGIMGQRTPSLGHIVRPALPAPSSRIPVARNVPPDFVVRYARDNIDRNRPAFMQTMHE